MTKNCLGTAAANFPEDVDEVVLPAGKTFPPGEYLFTVHYSGSITSGGGSENCKGFYIAYDQRYPLRAGTKVDPAVLKNAQLTTTFEATFARQVFPCFDEPSFKATFQVCAGFSRKWLEKKIIVECMGR